MEILPLLYVYTHIRVLLHLYIYLYAYLHSKDRGRGCLIHQNTFRDKKCPMVGGADQRDSSDLLGNGDKQR